MTNISLNEALNQYDDMLDEIYSFERVGGIFSNMQPSMILRTCDITAYNVGFSDWVSNQDNH